MTVPWSVYFWEGWQKTHRFWVLGPLSWAHRFGIPEWFTSSMTLSTCLRGMTKNLSFLRFRAVFMSYCPLFWGSMEIYKEYDNMYILERNDKKLVYGRFCELLPTILGFRDDLQGPRHSIHVWEAWPKTRRFCVYGHFCELLPTVLGFRDDLQGPWHSVHFWEAWPKLVIFLYFRAVFMSYCPQFWGSRVIYKVHDTQYMFKMHD
jgi:hypothetical protein